MPVHSCLMESNGVFLFLYIVRVIILCVLGPQLQIPSGISSNLRCAEQDKHLGLLSASRGKWIKAGDLFRARKGLGGSWWPLTGGSWNQWELRSSHSEASPGVVVCAGSLLLQQVPASTSAAWLWDSGDKIQSGTCNWFSLKLFKMTLTDSVL